MLENKDGAWWEEESAGKVLLKIGKHPKTVARQVLVACDMAQAPQGSDQETFPTLQPSKAEKLLKQKGGQNG